MEKKKKSSKPTTVDYTLDPLMGVEYSTSGVKVIYEGDIKGSVPPGCDYDIDYPIKTEEIEHTKEYYDTTRNMPYGKCTNLNFDWHLDKVAEKITNLLKEKNEAYGNSALDPLNIFSKLDAIESLKVRMDDKLARIKNVGINDETEDTVLDLGGYVLLLLMALERKGDN